MHVIDQGGGRPEQSVMRASVQWRDQLSHLGPGQAVSGCEAALGRGLAEALTLVEAITGQAICDCQH